MSSAWQRIQPIELSYDELGKDETGAFTIIKYTRARRIYECNICHKILNNGDLVYMCQDCDENMCQYCYDLFHECETCKIYGDAPNIENIYDNKHRLIIHYNETKQLYKALKKIKKDLYD